MPIQTERIIRRPPPPEHIDLLFGALAVSLLLHVISITGLWIYENTKPIQPQKPKAEAYVVHLIDPGPLLTTSKPARIKIKKAVAPTKEIQKEKTMTVPKKLTPVVKKTVAKKEKNTNVVKKKSVQTEIKKESAVSEETLQRKTSGIIDIKKFPYEWYLQIIRTRINRNWDTLNVNFYTDITIHVMVYFQISRAGAIETLRIEKSSMVEDVDNSALEAVKQSVPFPPLPPGYKEEVLEVHFGFEISPED